jgi:hypothetical protein
VLHAGEGMLDAGPYPELHCLQAIGPLMSGSATAMRKNAALLDRLPRVGFGIRT